MAIEIRNRKNDKKSYRVSVKDERGYYYRSKTFRILVDAKRYERLLKDRKDKGVLTLSAGARFMTSYNYFKEWLEYSSLEISEGWHNSKVYIVKTYILPIIGFMKIYEVKPFHISNVLAEMKEKGLSANYRKQAYAILRKAFKDAVEYYEFLEKSPVKKQDKPRLIKVESDFLKPNESYDLLGHCENHYTGSAIHLGLLVGLRISEIQALTWVQLILIKTRLL